MANNDRFTIDDECEDVPTIVVAADRPGSDGGFSSFPILPWFFSSGPDFFAFGLAGFGQTTEDPPADTEEETPEIIVRPPSDQSNFKDDDDVFNDGEVPRAETVVDWLTELFEEGVVVSWSLFSRDPDNEDVFTGGYETIDGSRILVRRR